MFQSTPPHGERQEAARPQDRQAGVSIHAPAWGATYSCKAALESCFGFNPRPRMGSDAIT